MAQDEAELDALTRRERRALRELLIESCAAAGGRAHRGRVEQLVGAAPLAALPTAAALHRVAGSVLRGLDGVGGVTDDVRTELTAMRMTSTLRHLFITSVLCGIGEAFDATGLEWVAMKGPVVAELLYPEVGDRSYADLDLLVDRRHYPQAMRILEELGYQHVIHDWARAEDDMAGQVGMTCDGVTIDLHWHLHYKSFDRRPYALNPEAMVERARRVVLAGATVPTLDPVDTLLNLAFHAARSDGHRLIWLKDVERAVVVDEPDLDELVSRCREYRCAPPVGLILDRARRLIRAPIPNEVIETLTPLSLRAAIRVASSFAHPVQLHERPTVTRALTRSARSSAVASFSALPERTALWLRRSRAPVPENETDDPDEKASYLTAVATSIDLAVASD